MPVFVLVICIITIILICFARTFLIEYKTEEKPLTLEYASQNDPYLKPFIIPQVINRIKCNELLTFAINQLSKSVVDGRYVNNKYSKQIWIDKNNAIVKDIVTDMANRLYTKFENAEDVQIVRYLPYQRYSSIYDSCCDNTDRCKEFVKRGGQRMFAVIIYLNQDFDDGEVQFDNLGLKFKPDEGGAIVIYPLAYSSNKCHPDSKHTSLPVTKNDKWCLHMWFRENKIEK